MYMYERIPASAEGEGDEKGGRRGRDEGVG